MKDNRDYINRKLTKIKKNLDLNYITQNNSRTDNTESQLNIKAILASYYIGCGGSEIGSVTSFLGVPGGLNWERRFSRKSPETAKTIVDLVTETVYKSLVDEVSLQIKQQMKNKL